MYDLPMLALTEGQYAVMIMVLTLLSTHNSIHDQQPRFLGSLPVVIILSRGFLLRKLLYKKWRKGWLRKTRLIMPMREEIMLRTRHDGGGGLWSCGYNTLGKELLDPNKAT